MYKSKDGFYTVVRLHRNDIAEVLGGDKAKALTETQVCEIAEKIAGRISPVSAADQERFMQSLLFEVRTNISPPALIQPAIQQQFRHCPFGQMQLRLGALG